jgi:hypothetical protein
MFSLGKPPLGFVNPFLYENGQGGMNDIMDGSNTGCNMNNTGPGFLAVPGWDAVRLARLVVNIRANSELHRLRVSGRSTLA